MLIQISQFALIFAKSLALFTEESRDVVTSVFKTSISYHTRSTMNSKSLEAFHA